MALKPHKSAPGATMFSYCKRLLANYGELFKLTGLSLADLVVAAVRQRQRGSGVAMGS
jgi:hypothetical protein